MHTFEKRALHCLLSFTLVELLVVIAIIALLTAILLPALSGAKKSAQRIRCVGNEKQHAVGICSYSDDNNGWLPINGSSPEPGWKYVIATYLNYNPLESSALVTKVFRCPSWIEKNIAENMKGGYGWNYHYMGHYNADPNGRVRVKLTSVSLPAQTIMSGDTTDWADPASADYQYATLYPASFVTNTNVPIPPVGNRHGGGVNMVWADFHVEWKSQTVLLQGTNSVIDWYYKHLK